MSVLFEQPPARRRFHEIYCRHCTSEYNSMAFERFMSILLSTKNMLTRYGKGVLASNEALIVNNIIILSNHLGAETCEILETAGIVESQYAVARAVLHHLGLPFSPGPLDARMKSYLDNLTYQMRTPRHEH